MKLISMATLINANSQPYVSIALDNKGEYVTWDLMLDDALDAHFSLAFCVDGLRDILAKQKRAQETNHGDLQYAESRAFYDKDFSNE